MFHKRWFKTESLPEIDPVINYTNLRKTQRKRHTILALSEADITSYDVPQVVVQVCGNRVQYTRACKLSTFLSTTNVCFLIQDSKLKVQESVSPKFYETTFTELSKSSLQNILNVLKWPPAVEKTQQDFVMVFDLSWVIHTKKWRIFTCSWD